MRSTGRIMGVAVALILLTAAIALAAEEKVLNVDGETVKIIRDEFGVPHVFAETLRGLYFGNGYAIAQDRLVQMEKNRRAAKGTMAEIFGPSALKRDKQTRILGYTEDERRSQFEELDYELQVALESYADGVNAYIEECLKNGSLPKWFKEMGFVPDPWEVTDSVAIGQMMAQRFGGWDGEELRNLKILSYLKKRFGDKETARKIFDDILFLNDPESPTTVPPEESLKPDKGKTPHEIPENFKIFWEMSLEEGVIERAYSVAKALDALKFDKTHGVPTKWGSYAWVVSGSRTASGAPILVGGPQMGFGTPNIAHEIHLSGPYGNVVGMSFAGIPGVLIGHNDHLAWTTTSGIGDLADIYVERLDPNNKYRYFYNGRYREMDKRTELILVKGQEQPVEITVCRTIHGPVIEWDEANGIAYSKKASYWGKELDTFVAIYGFNKAQDIEEFAQYAEYITTSHNFLAATQDGDIGYWYCGWYPIRSDRSDPRLPQLGTGEYEWRGYIPFDELPHSVNPKRGYLVNWNNKPATWWDNSDTPVWGKIFRIHRIKQLIESDDLMTFEDVRDIARDIAYNDGNADYFKPLILQAAEKAEVEDPKVKMAIRYLRAWDNHATDGSVAKSILDAWLRAVREEIFLGVLGDFGDMGKFHYFLQPSLILHVLEGDKSKCPVSYDYLGGRDVNEVIISALNKAVSNLEMRFGRNMFEWGYRLGRIKLDPLPPIPDANRGTYIQVVELTKPYPHGMNILPPGQSEDPNSPHYSDQRELAGWWMFKPMLYRREQIR
jgi:penicillin amidase